MNSSFYTKDNTNLIIKRYYQRPNRLANVLSVFVPKVYAAEEVDERLEKIRAAFGNETPQDRLGKMFSFDQYGRMSPEIRYVLRGGLMAFLFGGAIGIARGADKAKEDYQRRNVARQYESEYLARRDFTDRVTIEAVKNCVKYGSKIAAFSTFYLLITMAAANYNNKITIYEHIAAGASFGAISRINFGPKGVIVAGTLGGFLGLIAGGITTLGMKMSGLTFEELRYWQHNYYESDIKKTQIKMIEDVKEEVHS